MGNREFWNQRYVEHAWLGSGPGSRGAAQHYKASLLHRVLQRNEIHSIIDVGCGDLCWLKTDLFPIQIHELQGVRFIGLDISDVAIERNRAQFPDLEFYKHDLNVDQLPVTADLVLCFDVLIHQTTKMQFERSLTNLVRGATRHGLISYLNPEKPSVPVIPDVDRFDAGAERQFQQQLKEALEQERIPTGETADFGDLSHWLAQLAPTRELRHVGDYRFQSLYEIKGDCWLSF